MKSKIAVITLVVLMLFGPGCKKESAVPPSPELKAEFDVACKPEFKNTIFPSLVFGLAEIERLLQKPFSYFSIKIKPNIKTDIRIVIQESSINSETVITENDVAGEKEFIPSLKWKYDDLKKLSQPGNVDLTFVCYGNGTEIGRKDLKLGYRAINECVLAATIDNTFIPLQFLVAQYINEDSPVIDAFLQEVLQTTGLPAFTGYLGNDPEAVFKQVIACFYTLRIKGIKYSNIPTTSNTNANVLSQYIRFSDEVLTNTQANCADGTVFFCSVLRKIGIHTVMVFIPGHVYLGYYSDAAKQHLHLLETTMVGQPGEDFNAAATYQINSFNNNANKLFNEDYLDQYFIVDVDEARQFIKPIGR